MSTIIYQRKELEAVIEKFNRSIEQDREMYLMSGNNITANRMLSETSRRNEFMELLSLNPDQQEFNI